MFGRHLKLQNLFLVVVSYVFYGWWEWKFLGLIILSSTVDYTAARFMDGNENMVKKRLWLILSICINLGVLGCFKYYGFFVENLKEAFSLFGTNLEFRALNLILPVGISFYTFQTLSYSIDVYKGKCRAEKDIITFFAYVSFFPQLVAGPIERAVNLVPQFAKHRKFDYNLATDGCRQILWGLFKKIIIADNCAILANEIFASYSEQTGLTLAIGAVLFAFQIYGDFSGYSDIAIGTARLFGFNLMQNFAFPYFSRDMSEFWRRWHISLSTWFRDYLYIPLGGSRVSTLKKVRNVFAIFLVSGFWHGANWTYIMWGFINALFVLPIMLAGANRTNLSIIGTNGQKLTIRDFALVLFTFSVTCIAWIYFRAETIGQANEYIYLMFKSIMEYDVFTLNLASKPVWIFIVLLLIVEWFHRSKSHGLQMDIDKVKFPFRWTMYFFIIIAISFYGAPQQEFIYFQF